MRLTEYQNHKLYNLLQIITPHSLQKMDYRQQAPYVIRKLNQVAVESGTALYLYGGATLCAFSGISPKDLDFVVLSDNLNRFIEEVKRKLPVEAYDYIPDYEDPHYDLIYPGNLYRFTI